MLHYLKKLKACLRYYWNLTDLEKGNIQVQLALTIMWEEENTQLQTSLVTLSYLKRERNTLRKTCKVQSPVSHDH